MVVNSAPLPPKNTPENAPKGTPEGTPQRPDKPHSDTSTPPHASPSAPLKRRNRPPQPRQLVEHLMFTGLSESEARVYLSLLGASPVTAYELSLASGVPSSKVYQVLARLEERGAVGSTERRGRRLYHPQEPAEFIRMRRHMMSATLDVLSEGLSGYTARSPLITHMHGYDEIIDRARAMIESASESLLISIGDDEASLLVSAIEAAHLDRKVKLAVVRMAEPGAHVELPGAVYEHPIGHTIQHSRGMRTLVIVADSAETLSATITLADYIDEPEAEAAVGRNAGFVYMAEDFIRHDIYMLKMMRRLAPVIKESFGGHFEDLRDVFTG